MKNLFEYDSIATSDEVSIWVDSFRKKHGHAPRILHIGNIANNAYNNAKILNTAGINSDVICYDYYHIMGTPEWEDADFIAEQIDQFDPDWHSLELNGFKRPKWFVQGPLVFCIDYLLAKNQNKKSEQNKFWMMLSQFNKTSRSSTVKSYKHKIKHYYIKDIKKKLQNKIKPIFARIHNLINKKNVSHKFQIFLYSLEPNKLNFYIYFLYLTIALQLLFISHFFSYLLEKITSTITRIKRQVFRKKIYISENIIEMMVSCYREKFPTLKIDSDVLRSDLTSAIDIKILDKWKKLFKFYDFVIGYSTDGIYPLVLGIPYFAFEHGTIREIPYLNTSQGRLCAITYCNASHVFVTNFDCKKSAEFLAPNNYSLINHPFDENHGDEIAGFEDLRRNLMGELDSEFIFFFPTRHDWVEGTGYADKANDVFINAFGSLRREGFRVGMVCCSWGQNVEDSKKLMDKYGVSKHVLWRGPMATRQFERFALACDCVVDQFKLGAFGGVLFKAMAVGAPILTYLDEFMLRGQYSEMPPVINCKNEQEIIDAIRQLYNDRGLLDALRQNSRAWMRTHHSKNQILAAQIKQFKLLI